MDTPDKSSSVDTVTNTAYPVRFTEEVLLPLVTDESLQATMSSPSPPPPSHCAPPALPELRLVLLGRKGAGKSAAGNTILGGVGGFQSGKPTEECVKRRAEVWGRKVTVVDTPGWEWYYPLNSTPNWVKRETLRSVSLCPPGPHVLLLVVRSCASVTDDYIREIEEHLEPLGGGRGGGGGGRLWDHTMLLFTRGDELGLGTMEQRILTSSALQRLLQKCGNRYHVVNNLKKGDETQVRELMGKLEDMTEGKKDGNSHLEIESTVLLDLEADGKRRARERRKKQRQMEAQMQRGTIKAALMSDGPQGSELDAHHSFSKAPRRLPEVRLVLLGERETGKSSAGNTLLGGTGFFQVGAVTEECVRQQEEVARRLVTVVDTPGWEAGVAGGTPERVKREIAGSVALCPPGPHALLLTLKVDTVAKAEHVREHLELLGEGVWRHTMLLFTHGDQLREGVDIEHHIQGGGRDLHWLREKCRGRVHVISNIGSRGIGQVTELLEKVEKMATMNRCEAFSGLVQEVGDLSCRRNEKFHQRLKEMGDKMLRQEAEMKKLREREMKSIRWFFDRKRKVKSPGKAEVQKDEEEEEEERIGQRKNDISELEERIQWLTEDKEKEIQDLSFENERFRVALNQSQRERDEALLQWEVKDREIEELRERTDEQQVKLLDLERASAENEHKRQKREDAIRVQAETIESLKKEKAECLKKLNSLNVEMDQAKTHFDESLKRKAQETNKQIAELAEKLQREEEIKLLEKNKQQEEMRKKMSEEKQIVLNNLKQFEICMEKKCEEIKEQHKDEMERKVQEIKDLKLKHQEELTGAVSEIKTKMKVQQREEMDKRWKEKADIMQQIRQQHDDEVRDIKREKQRAIAELKEQFAKEIEEHMQANSNMKAELEEKHLTQMKKELLENEKDKERINQNHKKEMEQQSQEKEKEMEALKMHHQKETALREDKIIKLMEERRIKLEEETERKLKQKENELERLQQQYCEKIRNSEEENQREIEKQTLERERLKIQFENEIKEREKEKERCIKEMEQTVQEKEKEIEYMKVRIIEMTQQRHEKEKDLLKIEQKLNQNEIEIEKFRFKEEMLGKLQQREIEDLNYITQMKQKLEERENELQEMKQHLKECDILKEGMEQTIAEKDGVIVKLKQQIRESDEILQRKEEREEIILNQKREAEQQQEREMKEMKQVLNDMKTKLKEKEDEIKDALKNEQKIKEEKEDEVNKLMQIIHENTKAATEAQSLLAQRNEEIQEVEKACMDHLREIKRLKDSQTDEWECHVREKDEEMMDKIREKENELEQLKQSEAENQKEIVQLRLIIEQTKSELKGLTVRMEKEMTSLIQEYEKEIQMKNEDIESIVKEKNATKHRLEVESQQSVRAVSEKYQESRIKVEELEEQNEKMRKKMDNLKIKLEELEEEREKDVHKYQERDLELKALKEANVKQMNELKKLMEEQSEQRLKDDGIQEIFLKREKDIEDRKAALGVNEHALSKRGCDLNGKEKELAEIELMLERKDQELRKLEASLEVRQREMEKKEMHEQDVTSRAENIEKMEKELESLLKALEGKEKELSSHGQDLQMKVKGLRDQGKELKERESHLKNEERELLNWKSELQMQNNHITSTTRQLDEMSRDLALLKEELNRKEKNLKEFFKKLSKWEQGLKEREEKLCLRNNLVNGRYGGDDETDCFAQMENISLLNQEVNERKKGRGTDREESAEHGEDQRAKTASSAAKGQNCHLQTLKETETLEGREDVRGNEVRRAKVREGAESGTTISNFEVLSQSRTSSNNEAGSDMRVVILGETWSSRSPAGVTILGGEASQLEGSTFRSWRGEIAGRCLAVAEPLGLSWRGGGDRNTTQRRSILDSAAWCRPGPHLVLLLLPAFLTCTRTFRRAVEEDVSLLGEEAWRRTLVLFTWGETLGESAEQHILRNGELMTLMERCGGRYHVMSSKKKNKSGIKGLLEKMEEIIALNTL